MIKDLILVKNLINHGIEKDNKVNNFGYVSRLDNLQAMFGTIKIMKLKSNIEKRRRNAKIFNSELSKFVKVPEEKSYEYNTYHTYIIRADKEIYRKKHLSKNGIETKFIIRSQYIYKSIKKLN